MGKSLKQRLVSGVVWSAFDSFSGLAIQMICSLIVARLLTPADYGIVGMITVFSAIGLIIIDSGYGQALIRKQNASQVDFTSVFYLNILLSIFVYLVLYLFSPIIEEFYSIKGLSQVSRVLFLIIPINALGLIQNTILTKKVDFKTLGIISAISALISGVIGIVLAYKLRSVWAIVFQTIAMYGIRTFLLWVIPKWRPIRQFSLSSIKEMTPFASNLMFTGLLGTIVNNISPLLIGKIYSATQLGLFAQADRLQKLPSTTFTNIIQRVTFPVLVEVQDDNNRLSNAYLRLLSTAVFIIAPIMIYLILEARNIFLITLGEKWLTASYYFQILCITGILYPIHSLSINLLNIKGKSKLLFKLEALRKAFFLITIIAAINFDIVIFIWMQVVYGIIQLFVNLYFPGRKINMSLRKQFVSFIPELAIALISCIPCIPIIYLLYDYMWLSVLCSFFVYFSAYILLSKCIGRLSYKESVKIVKSFIIKR